MSYLAIARKWRPQRFEDLVGQGHVTRTLQNAIRMGRVHHAFLFTGARGVGKTSAARILAKALQCENGPADNPCNECGACREITAGSHPDVVEIDAASNNRVDDVRDLIEKVRYLPARGRRRIYIVDEVHMVTTQAFNALLKTLEEPPPHVVFIFATTDPQKILDTVLSRCQRFDFKMIPVRTIHERLKEICATDGVRITDGALLLVAREAGGSMRDAQSLLDQVLSFGEGELTEEQVVQTLGFIDRTLLHDVIEAVVVGDPARALDGVRRVQEFGYDARQFAKELLEALRHLMVIALVPDASRLVDLPADEQERLRALAAGTTPEAIQRRFDLLAGALDDIARSETPGMILEVAVLRLARVRPYVPVEALVERLVALERRLASGAAAPAATATAQAPPTRAWRTGTVPSDPPPPAASPAAPPAPAPAPAVRPAAVVVAEPPVPVAPPAPEPASVRCDPERWKAFLAQLKPVDALKWAVLSEGAFVSAEGAALTVELSGPKLSRARAWAADRKLLDAAARYFGAEVAFQFVAAGAAPAASSGGGGSAAISPAEEARRTRRAREEEVLDRAARDPAVTLFQRVFPGTTLERIVPLAEGGSEGA